jgi:glycosyltransferase involved in cell wall biosynthesis
MHGAPTVTEPRYGATQLDAPAQPGAQPHALVLAVTAPPPVMGQSVATAMLLRALDSQGVQYHRLDMSRRFHGRWDLAGYAQRLRRLRTLPRELDAIAGRLTTRNVLFYMQLGHGVHAMVRDLPLLARAARSGWHTVFHIHGGGFRGAFERAPRHVRRALAGQLERASRVVVLSDTLRSMVDGLVAAERVVVIDNGVEDAVIAGARLRRRAVGSGPGLRVLFLTNLMEEKGYRDVLAMAAAAERTGLPHEFTLAGERTESTTLDPRRFIARERLRRTRYVGAVAGAAKNRLLADADVLVLPSRAPEGQPIAVLEAMHYGLAVITTARGGLPDLIRDGSNGRIVAPADPAALLAALESLAADRGLLASIAQRNRSIAVDRFTEAAHARAMLGLLADARAEITGPVFP